MTTVWGEIEDRLGDSEYLSFSSEIASKQILSLLVKSKQE